MNWNQSQTAIRLLRAARYVWWKRKCLFEFRMENKPVARARIVIKLSPGMRSTVLYHCPLSPKTGKLLAIRGLIDPKRNTRIYFHYLRIDDTLESKGSLSSGIVDLRPNGICYRDKRCLLRRGAFALREKPIDQLLLWVGFRRHLSMLKAGNLTKNRISARCAHFIDKFAGVGY